MNTIGVGAVTSKAIEQPARHMVLRLSIPVFVMILAVIGWTGKGPGFLRGQCSGLVGNCSLLSLLAADGLWG